MCAFVFTPVPESGSSQTSYHCSFSRESPILEPRCGRTRALFWPILGSLQKKDLWSFSAILSTDSHQLQPPSDPYCVYHIKEWYWHTHNCILIVLEGGMKTGYIYIYIYMLHMSLRGNHLYVYSLCAAYLSVPRPTGSASRLFLLKSNMFSFLNSETDSGSE